MHNTSNIPATLASAASLAVLLMAVGVFYVHIPVENVQLVTAIEQQVFAGWMLAMAFYFGSSKGSQQKDDTISTMAANAGENPAPNPSPENPK